MANQIEILRTKVDASKSDFETLKQTKQELLEKEKIQEKLNNIRDVKKELEKLKTDTLVSSNPDLQKEIEQMENEMADLEKQFLSQFDTQLNNLKKEVDKSQEEQKDVPETEEKGRLKRQIEGLSDPSEENHALKNTARIVGGLGIITLGIRGISKLFKRKEKKSETPEGEKKSRWKMALLRGGGIFGGLAIRNNRDKIKDFFGSWSNKKEEKDENGNPKLPNSFDNLSEESKEDYEDTANEIDDFTKSNIDLSTVVEFPEDDNISKANIIFGLDKNSKNLQNFYTNDTLDYISGETTDGPIDSIMNRGKEKIGNILSPFLNGLESFKPFGAEFISKPAETLDKRLKGGEPGERERILSLFYREYMNVINYSVEKKKLLEERLAKEEVMGKDKITQEPTEKQQDAIEDLLDSNERRNGKLDSFFKKHKLMDLPSLCQEYGIESSEVSKDTKELLQDLQDEKDEILQKDDAGETVFSRAETDFMDGELQEDTEEDIDDTCEKLLDIEFGNNNKSLFSAYTHLITDIFGDNKELTDSFMEKTKLKELSEEFKSNLEGYRAKLKAGNFSTKDLQDLKTQTDSYLNAKKHYEISMKNIDYMSEGFNINRGKVLTLPIDAAKDIGKGLGKGKTNSRRERVGYGLGGCYVAGQTLYIGSKLVAGETLLGKGVKVISYGLGKTGIEIGKLPITLAEKGLQLLTGRTHLTSGSRARYIKNSPHLELYEKEALLKNAFLKGEISEKATLRVAKNINLSSGNGDLLNIDNLITKWIAGKLDTPEKIEIFKKYIKNKNLRKYLINEKSNAGLSTRDKFKYSIKDKYLKMEIDVNTDNISKLQKIENNIGTMTVTGTKERIFRETFMENTKTLDKIDDLMKNRKIMGLLTEIGNTSDDYIKLSKILANNFYKFSSLEEFEDYMKFFRSNKSTITNTNTFIRNSVGKRGKIKAMTSVEQTKYIETAKLNTSFLDRRINGMKENFKKSAETLKKLIKKSPYPEQVAEIARNLENMANTENEVYRAAQMAEEVGEGTWLSGKAGLMNQISPLLKEKAFLEGLSKAKTPQAIKELFSSKGINNIPEELAQSLSKTKSTQKIIDTVEYVANYDKLSNLMKILKNPSMKYAGRVAGRVLGVGTVVLGGVFAYNTYQEGSEIKKTNIARGDIKQQESLYDLGLTLAGACAFIPGIGWVASGVIILGTIIGSVVKESVFETLDKYNKNYKDFLQDSPLLIKQHILTTILGQNKTDAATGEYLARRFSSKDFEHLTKKTGSEAIKSLLYVEEWKRNPLAMFDITKEEDKQYLANLNPPKTAEDVGRATVEVDARVNKRYEYLKKKLGTVKGKDSKIIWIPIPGTLGVLPKKIEYEDGKEYLDIQKILTNDIVSKGKGMDIINQLLLESSYAVDNPETFDSPEKNEAQKKQLKEKLDSNSSLFIKLEGIYAKDPKSLLYIYRYTNDYINHINTFGTQDTSYDEIIKHIEYFSDYMNYKGLMTGVDIAQSSQGFVEADFIKCRDFFLNCDFKQPITSKEIYGETSKLQNILYRIATEVIGARVNSNSMEDIKNVFREENEKSYGLYFDDGDTKRLSVNGNYFTDAEYSSSDDSTIQKIKQDIQKKIDTDDFIDIGTGDKILNKEIGSKYIKIIDEELERK